jgi:plastocyanin
MPPILNGYKRLIMKIGKILNQAAALGCLCLILGIMPVKASDLQVEVTDTNGQKLADAVVYVEGQKLNHSAVAGLVEISQKGKKFHPLVTVVQKGANVNFPNKDSVRHHVYSFSPTKKFELKLYSGLPATPVLFDKTGTAILGCNIHDTMLAYVHVVDSSYFDKTDTLGIATLKAVPDGEYQLKVWHYAIKKENEIYTQTISLPESRKLMIKLDINPSLLVGQP